MSRKIIGYIGDATTYASLSTRHLGSRIELVSELTTYAALTGKYLNVQLARELAEDEDEAIAIATDLEWAAQDELRVMDIDITKDCGWPEGLMRHFDRCRRSYRYSFALAAE